eukprot:TRINITY_DN3025_c0_g1_i1.p1 TRINITY_DN3025_c0_g1~~TRINITY_DN3025_c0_g1_i1.p1  ORF type:complete len:649 (+),score=124.41 TRINITY_DN3025_c0_g1_i1:74-1948(+)
MKEKVELMFDHAYDSYMEHAWPFDELKPLSCEGYNTWGNYSLTLIDSLDMLVVMGRFDEFERQVWWLVDHVDFDMDINVSVFETNIRVLGGLLSAHLLISEMDLPLMVGRKYHDELLDLSYDLGKRLLPAFDTETGIPYGTVNLKYGVPNGETTITCTSCAGTFLLEFGILSVLTGDPVFDRVSRNAMFSLWEKRTQHDLVGNHIDTKTGIWVYGPLGGIGGSIDSFYEYMLKAAIFFNDDEYLDLFDQAQSKMKQHCKDSDWYIECNIGTGKTENYIFEALQSFWPGTQILNGDIEEAALTIDQFFSVWDKYGFTPERFDLINFRPYSGFTGYPLRPELIESIYMMTTVTGDKKWLNYAEQMLDSILKYSKTDCGFAAIENVAQKSLRDHMDSFFISETLKYFYLVADKENYFNKQNFIFNTEAHILPISPKFLSRSTSQRQCHSIDYTKIAMNTVEETFLYDHWIKTKGSVTTSSISGLYASKPILRTKKFMVEKKEVTETEELLHINEDLVKFFEDSLVNAYPDLGPFLGLKEIISTTHNKKTKMVVNDVLKGFLSLDFQVSLSETNYSVILQVDPNAIEWKPGKDLPSVKENFTPYPLYPERKAPFSRIEEHSRIEEDDN